MWLSWLCWAICKVLDATGSLFSCLSLLGAQRIYIASLISGIRAELADCLRQLCLVVDLCCNISDKSCYFYKLNSAYFMTLLCMLAVTVIVVILAIQEYL